MLSTLSNLFFLFFEYIFLFFTFSYPSRERRKLNNIIRCADKLYYICCPFFFFFFQNVIISTNRTFLYSQQKNRPPKWYLVNYRLSIILQITIRFFLLSFFDWHIIFNLWKNFNETLSFNTNWHLKEDYLTSY